MSRFIRITVISCMGLTLGWLLWSWIGPASPPRTQAAVERELERPVLDYDLVDGTDYVTFIWGDRVHVDRLIAGRRLGILDREWQWTGNWLASPVSNDLATAASGLLNEHTVLFGQINDRSISAVEIEIDGTWRAYDVDAPGYALVLEPGLDPGRTVRFLEVNGALVTEVTLLPSTALRLVSGTPFKSSF
jgi:hypothetical protein